MQSSLFVIINSLEKDKLLLRKGSTEMLQGGAVVWPCLSFQIDVCVFCFPPIVVRAKSEVPWFLHSLL